MLPLLLHLHSFLFLSGQPQVETPPASFKLHVTVPYSLHSPFPVRHPTNLSPRWMRTQLIEFSILSSSWASRGYGKGSVAADVAETCKICITPSISHGTQRAGPLCWRLL